MYAPSSSLVFLGGKGSASDPRSGFIGFRGLLGAPATLCYYGCLDVRVIMWEQQQHQQQMAYSPDICIWLNQGELKKTTSKKNDGSHTPSNIKMPGLSEIPMP